MFHENNRLPGLFFLWSIITDGRNDRKTIAGENAETYRIVLEWQKVGGVVLQIDNEVDN